MCVYTEVPGSLSPNSLARGVARGTPLFRIIHSILKPTHFVMFAQARVSLEFDKFRG